MYTTKSLRTATMAGCFILSMATAVMTAAPSAYANSATGVGNTISNVTDLIVLSVTDSITEVQAQRQPAPPTTITPDAALCRSVNEALNRAGCARTGNPTITAYNISVNPNLVTLSCTLAATNRPGPVTISVPPGNGTTHASVQACISLYCGGRCTGPAGRCMDPDPRNPGSCLVYPPNTAPPLPAPRPAPAPAPTPPVNGMVCSVECREQAGNKWQCTSTISNNLGVAIRYADPTPYPANTPDNAALCTNMKRIAADVQGNADCIIRRVPLTGASLVHNCGKVR